MRALERLFSSRPARIAIILLWLILGAPGGSFAQRLQDVQKNEGSSFLPGSSESVRELTLAKRFPSGERFAAITVIRRDGGLKPRDLAAIERTRASLAANVEANAAVERCRSRDIGSHVHALAADAWASTKAGLAAGDPRAPVFARTGADQGIVVGVRELRAPALDCVIATIGVGGRTEAEVRPDRDGVTASEQYQQLGRVRRPQFRSAAIAGDGRLDALADPRLVSKHLADPQRDH